MISVIVALDEPRASELAGELELEGITVVAVVPPTTAPALPAGIDAAIVATSRAVLTPDLVAACDRAGVRVIALGEAEGRMLARLGLAPALPAAATGWQVAAAIATDSPPSAARVRSTPHRVTVVWGPHGAPGRSTIAIQYAVELSRRGRRTALVDADTVAPSLSLLLGMSDDAPGIAAACRRAELGALDSAELSRLSATLVSSGGEIDVLCGINRPTRWPELSEARLTATLRECRIWSERTVVDVASAFDADDEATYDLTGPRRHAATVAAVREADDILAVAAGDPLGISRFLRDHSELRRLSSPTPITVVVNQVRPGPLGLDARGQIRRTLERFAGIEDVVFLPSDQRAADAALLHARPMADVTPRSPLVAAIRRLAATRDPSPSATADSSRGSSRDVRRLLPARAARGA